MFKGKNDSDYDHISHETPTVNCPKCGEENVRRINKCIYCGHSLTGLESNKSSQKSYKKAKSAEKLNKALNTKPNKSANISKPQNNSYKAFIQSPSVVFILYLLSFGLYFYWWFYKTLGYISKINKLEYDSAIWTLALLVPVLNIFILYKYFELIKSIVKSVGITGLYKSERLVAMFIVMPFFIFMPFPLSLLIFLPVLNLVRVQAILNQYWLALSI